MLSSSKEKQNCPANALYNQGGLILNYIKKDTKYSNFMFYPQFLFGMKISETAKTIYVLLLNRARLSQMNVNKNSKKWCDENGNIYLNYTIENLAKAMYKSESTIKHCLHELRTTGLIESVQVGACKPSKIYVKVPDEFGDVAAKHDTCYEDEEDESVEFYCLDESNGYELPF